MTGFQLACLLIPRMRLALESQNWISFSSSSTGSKTEALYFEFVGFGTGVCRGMSGPLVSLVHGVASPGCTVWPWTKKDVWRIMYSDVSTCGMVKFSITLTVPGSISPHRTDLHEENSSVESLNRLNPLMEAVEIQVEDGRPPTAGLQAPCDRESRVNCQQVDSNDYYRGQRIAPSILRTFHSWTQLNSGVCWLAKGTGLGFCSKCMEQPVNMPTVQGSISSHSSYQQIHKYSAVSSIPKKFMHLGPTSAER